MRERFRLSTKPMLVIEFDEALLWENGKAIWWLFEYGDVRVGNDGSADFFVEDPAAFFGREDDDDVDEFGEYEGKFNPNEREFVLAMRALAEENKGVSFLLNGKYGGLQ